MAKTPVNITAFAVILTLMLAPANSYTFEQYQSIASQATSAYNDANTELGFLNYYTTNANQYGVPRGPYDAKWDEIHSALSQASTLMENAQWDADSSDGYALAYSEQSSALSLSNQAKKDALSAQASLNSALAAPIQFVITPSQYSTTLYNDGYESAPFTITSQDSRIMACSASASGFTNDLSASRIDGYESAGFTVFLSAPSSGAGTKTIPVKVTCTVGEYATTLKMISIQMKYGADPAQTAMNSAKAAIDAANGQIDALDQAIKSAVAKNPSLDAFLGDARADLASAKTAVSQAQASSDEAYQDYYGYDPSTALPKANSALSSAQSASRYVTEGQGKITKATETFKAEGGQAQLTINLANSGIKSAQAWQERANGIIDNATALGMDTKDQVAMVATANGLIENAQSDILDAESQLRASKYAEAKASAAKALNNSDEAEGKAKEAYESLSSVMQACQAAHDRMLAAQSAISDADAIYTRLAAVVKNLPQEVNAKASAQDIETQRQKLDKAKNGYSKAQNELSAGYCNQSVNSAISAQNDAADASNMLGRVAEKMKDAISTALDAKVKETEKAIEGAKNATSSAGGTYGADTAKVAAAQKQLADAQDNLTRAEATVRLAKSATSLGDFLDKSSQAFSELEAVRITAQSSLGTANSAKAGIFSQYLVWIAAALAACGIGFMFWKLRATRKGSKPQKGKLGRLIKEGKFEEAARICDSKGDYKTAAEYYAKAGKFEKAKETYKKIRKKRRGV